MQKQIEAILAEGDQEQLKRDITTTKKQLETLEKQKTNVEKEHSNLFRNLSLSRDLLDQCSKKALRN